MTSQADNGARPARLVPHRPLPPYSYVTGQFPHPIRDPRGHSHAVEAPPVSIGSPDEWRRCHAYLWGIDLFNHGYYWEAHESWEAVWHAAGRQGLVAEFCQALIKLAAAGVKAREGRANGVRQHARRANQLLQSVLQQLGEQPDRFMGLSIPQLMEHAGQLADDPARVVDTRSEPVVIVMPFSLQPHPAGP